MNLFIDESFISEFFFLSAEYLCIREIILFREVWYVPHDEGKKDSTLLALLLALGISNPSPAKIRKLIHNNNNNYTTDSKKY